MKPTKKQIQAIEANKEITKNLKKLNYYSAEQLAGDILTYIKAISERRMINVIKSVSSSGMRRVIKFTSCEGKKGNFYQRQYYSLFIAMGYAYDKNKDGFIISGCGMDMIFHTNYSLIHDFKRLGFITEDQCKKLAQETPNTI